MSELSQYGTLPCPRDAPPATAEEIATFHPLLPAWELVREEGVRKLRNRFVFDDETAAASFVERVRRHAEAEDKEVEIREPEPGSIVVEWWSRPLGDIHPNDFIMAARTDGAYLLAAVGAEGTMSAGTPPLSLDKAPAFRGVLAHRFSQAGRGERP